MFEVFFQHIPRCLFEVIAVLGLIGFILYLCLHWKKDKAETILFAFSITFMIGWRMAMPINADRYALILIPIALYFTVYSVEVIIGFIRKFVRLPDYHFFVCALLIACMVKSFHRVPEDYQMFGVLNCLKEEAANARRTLHVVCNRDISYFLGDQFDVKFVYLGSQFCLVDLPEADYYLLKLSSKELPPDLKQSGFIELKRSRRAGGKFLFILLKKER